MSSGPRLFGIVTLVLLGLIAVAFFIKPKIVEPEAPAPLEAEANEPFSSKAFPWAKRDQGDTAKPAMAALEKATAGGAAPEPELSAEQAASCKACREQLCTNYQGSGVDLIDGCFAEINPAGGADPTDQTFVADCTAVVQCARDNHCTSIKHGAASCYCGSIDMQRCVDDGPAPDAPCLREWQRATRSSNHREISERFSDMKYPAGWASFMLECEMNDCREKCRTRT